MKKGFLALSAGALAIIGAGTMTFSAATQSVMAAGFGNVEKIPTSYQVASGLQSTQQKAEAKKESSKETKRANYHVSMDSLNMDEPSKADLTMKEAAREGEQYLKDIYGLDMEGAYVYMMYSPGTETFGRAFWSGDVLFEKEQKPESTRWSFMVDAVTGELFNIGYAKELDVDVPLEADPALAKDYSVYAKLARKYVERCRLLDSKIDKVKYGFQGYQANDPDITVSVVGENGEIVNMTFSRYDQELLGIITDKSRRISDEAVDYVVDEAYRLEQGDDGEYHLEKK